MENKTLDNPDNTSELSRKVFQCKECDLYARYEYFGHKPYDHYQKTSKDKLILFEDCYICDDPFTDSKSRNFLILGSDCSICKKKVCVSSECSIFYYTKRFCIKCALEKIDEFPNEIKLELEKIKESQD